jgi:hypothetical protein
MTGVVERFIEDDKLPSTYCGKPTHRTPCALLSRMRSGSRVTSLMMPRSIGAPLFALLEHECEQDGD